MTDEQKDKLIAEVEQILKGIDRCEVDDEDGWWETTGGAEFGAAKLKELKELIRRQ